MHYRPDLFKLIKFRFPLKWVKLQSKFNYLVIATFNILQWRVRHPKWKLLIFLRSRHSTPRDEEWDAWNTTKVFESPVLATLGTTQWRMRHKILLEPLGSRKPRLRAWSASFPDAKWGSKISKSPECGLECLTPRRGFTFQNLRVCGTHDYGLEVLHSPTRNEVPKSLSPRSAD